MSRRTKKRGDGSNISGNCKIEMINDLADLRKPNPKLAMRKGKKQYPKRFRNWQY